MAFAIDPLSLALGLAFGAGGAWLALRSRGDKAAADAKAAVEQERAALADRLAAEFRRLSTEALGQNNRQFLDLAKTQFDGFQAAAKGDINQILQPVRDSLAKVDKQISEIEKDRVGAYGKLSYQVEEMAKHHLRLGSETQKLVNAMRNPGVRGRWGELQLRRVIEMAGMQAHVDFVEQASFALDDSRQRPDVIVKLPGGRTIVIDSKVPFDHYFEAATDEGDEIVTAEPGRREALLRHAKAVRNHMTDLGRKSYWEQFKPSPDLVVMFLPDEGFFSAALRVDPAYEKITRRWLDHPDESSNSISFPTALTSGMPSKLVKSMFIVRSRRSRAAPGRRRGKGIRAYFLHSPSDDRHLALRRIRSTASIHLRYPRPRL